MLGDTTDFTGAGVSRFEGMNNSQQRINMILKRNVRNESDVFVKNQADNYHLSQNYPNPFNPTTKIQFELPQDGKVKLVVYDMIGREVMKLIDNEFRHAGIYSVELNGENLSSGVYLYRLESGNNIQTKRMILIK